MKKKSILIVCISALMALAMFVGCDNAPVYPAFPTQAFIRQTGDFLAGQEFDASKFEVVAKYLDGSTQTLAGVAVKYTDTTGGITGMSNDDTVSATAGYDYNDRPVGTGEVSVTAYPVSRIEATSSKTSFALTPSTLNSGDFTVTAYYVNGKGAEAKMVLSTEEYEAKIAPVATSEEQNTDEYKTANEVPAKVTISLKGNLAAANSDVQDYVLEVTGTKDAGEIPSTEITKIELYPSSSSYALPAFNYNGVLPEANLAKSMIKVTVTSEAQNGAVVSADTVDGVELYWADARGEALETRFLETTDFVGKATEGVVAAETGIYLAATYNGEKINGVYPVPVAKTSIDLVYGGSKLVQNTLFDNIKLSANDFKAELSLNDKYAETLVISDDMLKITETGTQVPAPTSTVEVTLTYNGLTSTAELPVVGEGDLTYEVTDVELVETPTIIYKQVYDRAPVATTAELAMVEITASNTTVNEVTSTWTGITVAYSTTNDKITALADGVDLSDVDTIYLAVTYTYDTDKTDTFFKEISTVEPTINAVVLGVKYTYTYDDKAMLGSPIEWTILGQVNGGSVAIDPADVTFYVDGYVDSMPAKLTADVFGVVVGVNYNGLDSNEVTLEDEPNGYVDATNLDFIVVEAAGYIGTKMADLDTDSFDFAEESYSKVPGYEGDESVADPVITAVKIGSKLANIVDGSNSVVLTVSYVGEKGAVVETYDFDFDGKSWDEGTATVKLGDVTVGTGSSGTGIEAGTYAFSQFTTGLKAHGTSTVKFVAEIQTDSGDDESASVTENGFTLGEDDVIKITLTWTGAAGRAEEKYVYVKGVVTPPVEG